MGLDQLVYIVVGSITSSAIGNILGPSFRGGGGFMPGGGPPGGPSVGGGGAFWKQLGGIALNTGLQYAVNKIFQ